MNKPVAWMDYLEHSDVYDLNVSGRGIPLYTETLVRQQQAEIEKLKETIDKLLDHCDDPECWECGKIICPYGGAMHFHHDGCPTCAEMESPNEQ